MFLRQCSNLGGAQEDGAPLLFFFLRTLTIWLYWTTVDISHWNGIFFKYYFIKFTLRKKPFF